MPLLDHFDPPLLLQYPWDSFHSSWATRISDSLNELLPPEFLAAEHTHAGADLEIDVATFETDRDRPTRTNGPAVATAVAARAWAPPAPPLTLPAIFPDSFEVRVFSTTGGLTLVGAIELISPGNKDRAEKRRAFVSKCASYLHQGVSVVIIDVVTNRKANLHNELMDFLEAEQRCHQPDDTYLYAVAYRPVLRKERPEIDVWPATCVLGQPLPVLPLRLTGDLFVPVDFETAYHETCRRRRLA
jgi:hypothetical protein